MKVSKKHFMTFALLISIGLLQACKDSSTKPVGPGGSGQSENKQGVIEEENTEPPIKHGEGYSTKGEKLVLSNDKSVDEILIALAEVGLNFIYKEDAVAAVISEEAGQNEVSEEVLLKKDIAWLQEIDYLLGELVRSKAVNKELIETAGIVQVSLRGRLGVLESLTSKLFD